MRAALSLSLVLGLAACGDATQTRPTDAVEAQTDSTGAPVEVLDPPVDVLGPPVDVLDPPVDALDPPVDALDPPVDALDPPVDALDPPVDALDPPVDALDPLAEGPDTGPETAPDAAPKPWACENDGDLDQLPIPEASAAALLPDDRWLVTADSGNLGRALLVDPTLLATAPDTATVRVDLPLGANAGDDLEGLATAPDGLVWGLTSSGYLSAWRITANAAELVHSPTPISADPSWACDPKTVNCGPNYEGFCLHPAPAPGDCAGYAASKARGVLVCLVPAPDPADGFVLDPTRQLAITVADHLSECAFEPMSPYRLVAGGNVYDGNAVWLVDPATPAPDTQKTDLGLVGAGNQEGLLWARDGRIHSFGDLQNLLPDASPHIAWRCR